MSMEHQAFVFDYAAFEQQLKPLLEAALASGDPSDLRAFIAANLDSTRDPYEGEPLADDWEDMLDAADVDQYGDFALTKFYDPQNDVGLGTDWETVQTMLAQHNPDLLQAVLGRPVGPEGQLFDPGKMGSYFESAEEARQALDGLETLLREHPELSDGLADLRNMLQSAVDANQGLYVTF